MNKNTSEYMKEKVKHFELLKNGIRTLQDFKSDLNKNSELAKSESLKLKDAIINLIDNRITQIEHEIEEL